MLKVKCYSGYKTDERPVSFSINEKVFFVDKIIDQWYGEYYTYFKLRASDKCIYILKHDERKDLWEITYFLNLLK